MSWVRKKDRTQQSDALLWRSTNPEYMRREENCKYLIKNTPFELIFNADFFINLFSKVHVEVVLIRANRD